MMSTEELREVVREEVRRTLLQAFLALIPYVSEEEQKEIEEKQKEVETLSKKHEEFIKIYWIFKQFHNSFGTISLNPYTYNFIDKGFNFLIKLSHKILWTEF